MIESFLGPDEKELFSLGSAAIDPFGLSQLWVNYPNAWQRFIQAGACSVPVSAFEAGRQN